MSRRKQIAAVLATLAAGACARALPPPGGDQDREPPRLLSTSPENLQVLPAFYGPVVFRFDERLSERGFSNNLVLVSPEQGTPTVNRNGSELRVRVEGGWQPNRVYRIVILPGLQDRRNNQRQVPTELVFSTGDSILPTAIAGLITDRITARPVSGARVTAIATDSTVHATVTDTAGFFALRYVPVGSYTVQAYEDRNRNRRQDPAEAQASRSVVVESPRDTQTVTMALLPIDTLPARLASAVARDSAQVRLTFDDYLDPQQSLGEATVRVFQLPDSTLVRGTRIMYPHELDALRRAQAAAADTTRPRQPPPAQPDTAGLPLPTRELVVGFDRPLPPETRFRVIVTGITNIAGVPGGGGTATFETPARPPERPAVDTSGVRRDTSGVRRDTSGVRRDTSTVRHDTSTVRHDTSTVGRDTIAGLETSAVQRDTSRRSWLLSGPDRKRRSR